MMAESVMPPRRLPTRGPTAGDERFEGPDELWAVAFSVELEVDGIGEARSRLTEFDTVDIFAEDGREP